MEYRDDRDRGAAPRYVGRAVAASVASAPAPVAVLEGARGVGKTALALSDPAFRRFHYVTLADPEQLAQASADAAGWLASLPRPAVIDDAHRVDSLLDAARLAAPKRQGKRPSFVLLSPQHLRCQGDQGPRPARFMLFPLTQAELAGRPGCIADDLFDGNVARRFRSTCARSDLRTMMRVGGLPARALPPTGGAAPGGCGPLAFQADLDRMRAEGVGPGTTVGDLVERSVLREVLHHPGTPVRTEAMARSCHIGTEALTARLESMRERFLIHRLPMLDRKKGRGSPFAGTRIHPMDTNVAVEGLRHAGHDIAAEPPAFSKALKTLCVNQLAAASQWAAESTECRHWRRFDRRMREVDLVLVRGDRLVGVSVRNSMAACPSSIGALQHLAADERFERGFIVYMGPFTRQLAENIWAVPVSALWEEAAFREEEGAEGCGGAEGAADDPDGQDAQDGQEG